MREPFGLLEELGGQRDPEKLCQRCGVHRAMVNWAGTEGILGVLHGHHEEWCACCAVRAQLDYAREIAARIPDLEAKLAAGGGCP
jgi:hypothetical protein